MFGDIMDTWEKSDLVIIGAGPMGIALAVRMLSIKKSFTIIEKGSSVGSNILEWGHVHFFSNWKECVDLKSQNLLSESIPLDYDSEGYPSGNEFVKKYLIPLANLNQLKNNIVLRSEVVEVEFNFSTEKFLVTFHQNGETKFIETKVVVDASGNWGNTNKLIKDGSDYYPHINRIPKPSYIRHHFQDAKVAIVGNGHSAMNSIALVSDYSNAEINWLIRKDSPNFGKSKVDGQSIALENKVIDLVNQKQIIIHKNFLVSKVENRGSQVEIFSEQGHSLRRMDYLIENIGANADYSFLKNIPINVDDTFNVPANLACKINPKFHTCSSLSYNFEDTVISDVDYYVVGMKSFGKASNFLLSYGYDILDELAKHIK